MRKPMATPPPLVGTIGVPGDKSISHRALMIAALAPGRSSVRGINLGADVGATAAALRALGAGIGSLDSGEVEVEGCGGAANLAEPAGVVDVGNSGTTIRCLAGICAGVPGVTVLTGDDSVRDRPMLRVVVPLRQMGADIDGRRHGDRAPLTIRGGELTGIDHHSDVASAQVKTAVLFAGLAARGATSVTEPRISRDHTERMLVAAAVDVVRADMTVRVVGGSVPAARDWSVPGDVSAALFLIVAATLVPGSDLTIEDVGLNPTRATALDVLRAMGGAIDIEETGDVDGEPRGRVSARHAELFGTVVPHDVIPALIDEVPALAIAATAATGTTTFEGVGELRVKESDRLAALVDGITELGGSARADGDDLTVEGGALRGGRIDPRGDHRIAMAFAVAGLATPEKVTVGGWSCVDTSFPGFLETLAEAQRRR